MTNTTWQWKRFEKLSVDELFEIYRLRQQVFVIEQSCIYADIDEIDKIAWHLFAYKVGIMCAYSRVYVPLNDTNIVSVGRVVTNPRFRGSGLGKQLMHESLK
ncbi:UNVERIFIED_CONTAM: hypothetical protein GTU68_023782, partial [Idotea baltica]|nr:hypothetical protein [Idotea baltica]